MYRIWLSKRQYILEESRGPKRWTLHFRQQGGHKTGKKKANIEFIEDTLYIWAKIIAIDLVSRMDSYCNCGSIDYW